MAELDVRVKYSYLPAKAVFASVALLMPIWAVLFPIGLVGWFATFLIYQRSTDPSSMLSTSAGMMFWSISCGLIAILSGDRRIILNQSGISVPFFLSPGVGFRRNINWSDVTYVSLLNVGNSRQLLISDRHRKIKIGLRNMTAPDAEKVLLAVQLWAQDASKDASILTLRDEASTGESLTYTAMWEDELARRFTSTGFVPLEPGKSLRNGSLKVVRQLFFGGLSALYLCQHNGRELVVLKEAALPHIQDDALRTKAEEMFAREATFLTRLEHPSLVKVLDHFAEGGRNYLLLEHINGQDLRQLVLQHGPQDEATVRRWAIQICEILQYLHAQTPPILHRDLTPDNIVLAPTGQVVLIDFGAANEFIGNATGTLVGKQSFIAPEQFRGKACPQSDIYAFGCTLHFLLTGKESIALSTSHPKSIVNTLSEEVDALVSSMTELDLHKRLVSAEAVLERLSASDQTVLV